MKPNSTLLAVLIAASTGIAVVAQGVQAGTTTVTSSETETPGEVASSTLRIPASGTHILDGEHGARLALFDGNLDLAKEMISGASDQFHDHMANFAIRLSDAKMFVIPVDSGLQFAEGFEPNEAHSGVIEEAGVHIRSGDVDRAVDVMTGAGIELDVRVVALPVETAIANLKQALTDIEAGEIHKANMALKAVETSIVIEDYKPGALPAQSYPLAEILQG
ncbi:MULTISPECIES: YfdX family protein [unclassified Roseovarius]|uniref:YfdX family protein n=1 Tax=unclassified Roseovarius TaxID=2614913 RepID=UPI00273FDF9D|nr:MULTISPECIES: YfdX family protein [unclassified Roseovarius]